MSACRGRRDGGSWREGPRSSSLLQYSSLHLNLNSLFMFLYWLSCLSRRRAGFRRGLCSRRHSIIACSLPLFPISASLRRPFLLPCFPASLSFTSLSSSFSFSAPLSHFILISPSTLRTPLSLSSGKPQLSPVHFGTHRFRPIQQSSLNVAMTFSPLLGV